ncbi:uncharacterized protein [Typha angustifolia]|uniref:uncharacterized protein n=1 Tax=Typha angustifolia TaxID=59011 RepID=UPI003C2B1D3B
MMENDGEAGDDQGSGWLEVKKKHRISSKLSLQKASGGSLNKTCTFSQCHQASSSNDGGNWHGGQQFASAPSNSGPDFVSCSTVYVDGSSRLLEIDCDADCIDKMVIKNKCDIQNLEVAAAENVTKATEELLIKEDFSHVSRIKCGDVEDVALIPHDRSEHSNSSPKLEFEKFADNKSHEDGDTLAVDELVTFVPYDQVVERKVTVTSDNAEQFPSRMLYSIVSRDSVETSKESKNFPFHDIKVAKDNQPDSSENLEENHKGDIRTMTESVDYLDIDNVAVQDCSSSPTGGTLQVILQKGHNISDNGPARTSELSTSNTCMLSDITDGIFVTHRKNCEEVSATTSVMASIQDHGGLHDHTTGHADFGEGEPGESKERFRQRLWCFLFENLNRSIDELYLLCELECDMEQIDEAILVLEEATSDFKELKCRVEHFDNTKQSSLSLPKDGIAMTVKADHRRPHALSWEVRRMTTSPHRAEILSSSLEAFNKIQLERARKRILGAEELDISNSSQQESSSSPNVNDNARDSTRIFHADQRKTNGEKKNRDSTRQARTHLAQSGGLPPQSYSASSSGKSKREPLGPVTEIEKQVPRKDKESADNKYDKQSKTVDMVKKHISLVDKEKEKEKQKTTPWKSMDAWKEKRNWEDILKSPMRSSSRVSHSPGMSRKAVERARVLHDKLMSPEKKKKSALDFKKEAEEKHARAMRIRNQLENERIQRLQRTSEKLNRVNEWQAVRSVKLREVMNARQQRSESRHEAYLAQVVKRAGDESSKVNEVRFITSLNEENKKFMLRQKLHDSEMRRAEKLQVIKSKQKEDSAREEAVLERRRLLEAEKLQRLAETQRKKEEAQVRREEERKASSAAREARAVEQLRRKEIRAKAQQEEAVLLAQKLAERLRESEQRRKYYLEQIREKASMDFRDQSSPLQRRSLSKDSQSRYISTKVADDCQILSNASSGDSSVKLVDAAHQPTLKRRIKKIRQKLMALKHEFVEPPIGPENTGIGYRAAVGTARAKMSRWLQDLQRFRQARKEGAASIGLIVSDVIKFLEGKDLELHASRQAGMLDFISSALPASHTSKPETCQVTVYLLRLLRILLSLPANRSYFLVQNLLPPIIPMLSASLENYINVAASPSPGCSNIQSSKTSAEYSESVAEVLDSFLWTVTAIVGHVHTDDRQLQMQGGLIELIVSYQVIHRLRDLFALYDRPQVEGAPFPSSIIFTLNLLVVLTSKPGTFSTIDWESCKFKTLNSKVVQECEMLDSRDIEGQFLSLNQSGDNVQIPITHELPKSTKSKSSEIYGEEKLLSTGISDTLEANVILDEYKGESFDISSGPRIPESGMLERTSLGASGNMLEDHPEKILPQKDEKNSTEGCAVIEKLIDEHTMKTIPGRRNATNLKQPVVLVLSAIAETGLVSLPSLLTAVLLQANNKSSAEQGSSILPSNFEEVATGVLKVLNNIACLDITLLQFMLARSDLKMEFFHLISFLLTHCTNKWKAANDQVGLLLLESLLLLGYFALFHPGNQAVLRWGKSPTILHKVCDLPFVFFSDPELTPILAATLVAACYGCDQNKGVVQQEISTDMLLTILKTCRQGLLSFPNASIAPDSSTRNYQTDSSQIIPEARSSQVEIHVKSSRKRSRPSLKKGVSGIIRVSKPKIQRDGRVAKACDSWALKHNFPSSDASSIFMLHCRFPSSFLDKAEEFFSTET